MSNEQEWAHQLMLEREREAIEAIGGELRYINTGTVFHSGELMSGRYLDPAREDQES